MHYKPYPTEKTQKQRKERKKARNRIFVENKALHSSRTKKEKKQQQQ